jgi:hypothetical protein
MQRYQKIEAWSSFATALFTGIGLVIAIAAAVVAYFAYRSAEKQSELKTTADAISEWSKASPPNVTHCFAFLSYFDSTALREIVARSDAVKIPEGSEASLSACISDQDPIAIKTLIDKEQGKLLRKGVSFIAERVDTSLDADDVIAALIVEGIGRGDILNNKIGRIICRDDLRLVDTLHQVPQRKDSYPSIMKFAALPAPLGCHSSAISAVQSQSD